MKEPEPNPKRDSWKPADKAEEAAIDNPAEFDAAQPATEDSRGPVPSNRPKTHGESVEEIRPPEISSYPPA